MKSAAERVEAMLAKLDAAWVNFHDSFAGLTDEELLIAGVTDGWSVRDLIAHVTWWDEEAIRHLPVVLEGKRPPRYLDVYGGLDAFNRLSTEQRAGLSLDEVQSRFVEAHERLVDYIRSVPPERIVAEPRFRSRLRLDTYSHYPIHAAQIREWREARSGLANS